MTIGDYRQLGENLLLVGAGMALGVRIGGAGMFWGWLGTAALVLWLVVIWTEPGPNDPPRTQFPPPCDCRGIVGSHGKCDGTCWTLPGRRDRRRFTKEGDNA